MKKNCINKILFFLMAVLPLLFSCKGKTSSEHETAVNGHREHVEYVCPMHPQIIRDKPGKCPICGMELVPISTSNELHIDNDLLPLLKPANEQIVSTIATITPEHGTKIFNKTIQGVISYDTRKQESISSRVSGRIERMYIKYNFQPVRNGQLIMEIYSPDLAVAQRDLIFISKSDNDPSLLQRARERLSLLGMQPAQINQVLKSGKPIYRVPVYSHTDGYIVEKSGVQNAPSSVPSMASSVSSSDGMGSMNNDASASSANTVSQPDFNPSPVMIREGQYVGAGETIFTVYKGNNMVAEFSFKPSVNSEIKAGKKLMFFPVLNPKDMKSGAIGLIEPVQQKGKDFSIARVYLSDTNLKPGQLVTASIPVVINGEYWLPENAVLQLGNKSIVFKKLDGVFVPEQVQTGIKTSGLIEIKTQIGGWQIAKSAGYLVDNESFIRTLSNDKQ